jgi:hypothetical protein
VSEHHRVADVFALGLPPGPEFSVAMYLAHCWNEKARAAWPSVETIARVARISERHARRSLRKLEALGHISSASARSGGRAKSIRYRLNLPSCLPRNPDIAMSAFGAEKPGQERTETRTNGVINPDIAMSPEPLRTIKNHAHDGDAPSKARARRAPWTPEPESPEAKHRRQLLAMANLLGVQRQRGEGDFSYLQRLEEANNVRLRSVG